MLTSADVHALGFAPGMTSDALRSLLRSGLTIDDLTTLPDDDLRRHGLRGKAIRALHDPRPYYDEAERQRSVAAERCDRIITIADDDYPAALRQIWSAPIALYVRGALLPEDERAIAIVGTRNGSVYGKITAERYAREITRAGVAVVSGLARGVDMWAHKAAMEGRGRTIAVVASGLDMIQPMAAAALAERIAGQGAIVTEYPFGARAQRSYFPQRNRIISGITRATLVVESDERGGAMITARYALDQNRDVFAVPGPIGSPKSRGTNELIRTDRARLTQTPDDLLEALGYRVAPPEGMAAEPAAALGLSLFEQKVHDILGAEPRHIDEIGIHAGLAPGELMVTLLSLEFKGLVRQMAGKMFLRG